ncbi:LysM peptidoglycan-binding domain-containing protein [Neisseria sp. Ec49-e6-T10]|uniref:LysM peptidoglycan-binding domain-containing protein n=1 Tax=Neisseria sp. Ec49-e6-T10 TaxID=3140744 RepID=UPI003EB9087A
MRKLIITFLLTLGLSIPVTLKAETLKIRPDAPSRYVVKKGDTLWGISGRYLYRPWNWPQLWGWNKEQIKNPHLIYPGQALVLTYIDGQPRLGVEGGFRNGRQILSPQIRLEDSGQPVSGISLDVLKKFFSRPQIISQAEFERLPRIVAGPDTRVILDIGNRIYARGVKEKGTYSTFTAGKKIIDPDTNQFLGYEIVYGGDVAVQSLEGDVQTLIVTKIENEILVGDRLLEIKNEDFDSIIPHAVDNQYGKIVSTYNGAGEVGQYQSITINLGKNKGIETGHVFSIYKEGKKRKIHDVDNLVKTVEIPAEEVGIAIVYRTFDNLSYALVMVSKENISLGNRVGPPNQDMTYFLRK